MVSKITLRFRHFLYFVRCLEEYFLFFFLRSYKELYYYYDVPCTYIYEENCGCKILVNGAKLVLVLAVPFYRLGKRGRATTKTTHGKATAAHEHLN